MPEETALATERRRPPGFTVRSRVRLHGLQSAEQDAGPGGAGAARDTDDDGERGSGPQPMRPLQPLCS